MKRRTLGGSTIEFAATGLGCMGPAEQLERRTGL
jgi:hypothetical protein